MDLHSAQREVLHEMGTLEKAEALLVHPNPNGLYPTSLIRTSRILQGGETMHTISVRFGERKLAPNGQDYINATYVAVAMTYNGTIYPCSEFSSDEAKVAVDMTDELERLRNEGFLPGLNDSLNYIRDPSSKSKTRPRIY